MILRNFHRALALIVLCGCNFDPAAAPPERCAVDQDCRDGRVCVDARCVATGVAAGVDGGHADADGAIEGCEVDRDGDGYFFGPGCAAGELDCDDNDALIFPGADARCNGEDNDCDGAVDEGDCECVDGLTAACGSDVGACSRGNWTCGAGVWGACEGEVAPSAELCDSIDNDCDGTTDEGCPCAAGESQACGLSDGTCAPGTQRCIEGAWSECEGGVGPAAEACNGEDDDCDGVVDNDVADAGGPCDASAEGVCAAGRRECVGGALACVSSQQPAGELCNGLDDDCDGTRDETIVQACTSACGPGTQRCEAGMFGECAPDDPPAETCNGRDDDCDGAIDEEFPQDGRPCDTGGVGACREGTYVCDAGQLDCAPTSAPAAEVCDGVDNDCDGLVDEDPQGKVLSEACGAACPARSVRFCFDGSWSACDNPGAEVCDGTDTNCDSVADNQGSCYQRCPDQSSAPGTLDCATDSCQLPAEICGDGIDNDCDGVVDSNCDDALTGMVYVPGGTFVMGTTPQEPYASDDEFPRHTVELDPFLIDRHEVSRADYGSCVLAGACSLLRQGCPLQLGDRQKPIVCLTWNQANAVCQWKGKRLPTEAEWEKAARGPYPRTVRWPWGDTEDATLGIFDCSGSATQCSSDVASHAGGASYYGMHHMAGNAAEWVADYYAANYYVAAYVTNPYNATNAGMGHVVRGGGYEQDIEFARVANRAVASFISDDNIGVRCAK